MKEQKNYVKNKTNYDCHIMSSLKTGEDYDEKRQIANNKHCADGSIKPLITFSKIESLFRSKACYEKRNFFLSHKCDTTIFYSKFLNQLSVRSFLMRCFFIFVFFFLLTSNSTVSGSSLGKTKMLFKNLDFYISSLPPSGTQKQIPSLSLPHKPQKATQGQQLLERVFSRKKRSPSNCTEVVNKYSKMVAYIRRNLADANSRRSKRGRRNASGHTNGHLRWKERCQQDRKKLIGIYCTLNHTNVFPKRNLRIKQTIKSMIVILEQELYDLNVKLPSQETSCQKPSTESTRNHERQLAVQIEHQMSVMDYEFADICHQLQRSE